MALCHSSRVTAANDTFADKAAPQDDIGFEVSQPEQALGERFGASARVAKDQRRPPPIPLKDGVAGEEVRLARRRTVEEADAAVGMAGSVDDFDVFERRVAFLEDDVDRRILADDRSLPGTAAKLRAEATPDALERRPRFVAVLQDLVSDPTQLVDCLKIALVADVVEEDVSAAPFEEVRVRVQYPRPVDGALPQVTLELPHRCHSATAGVS